VDGVMRWGDRGVMMSDHRCLAKSFDSMRLLSLRSRRGRSILSLAAVFAMMARWLLAKQQRRLICGWRQSGEKRQS